MSRSGSTAVLALASDKVNALDREVLQEISAFVEFCEQDSTVGALVITGEGSVFSAGLNVNQVLANEMSYTDGLLDDLSAALVHLFRCPKPTIAAINGSAIAGGCLLASACDKRLIADEARIGVTELRVGVSFPVVAIELLRHTCGARAEQLIFGAELLDAEGACQYGLAHQHFPRAVLQSEAMAAAEQLEALDARAYALAKASTRRSALMAMALEHEDGRSVDLQVREHWKDDQTRANLEKLLKPKG
jgi:enoyl-CoA hydratase/carnithine racemase